MTDVGAVVLDFDGVIADSEPLHLRAFQEVLQERGLPLSTEDYYAHYLGFSDEEAFAAIAAAAGRSFSQADVAALLADKASRMTALLAGPEVLFPGAEATVRALARQVPLAIASGARRDEIELVLEARGLTACFAAIVASGETPRSKPAPDPYVRALDLLQTRGLLPAGADGARRSVAVEDSRWGIESARGAGLRCIAVTTSYPPAELGGADAVVEDLSRVSLALLRDVVARA
jgi:HAD superfamily hydrolase (TIGR01509 family)